MRKILFQGLGVLLALFLGLEVYVNWRYNRVYKTTQRAFFQLYGLCHYLEGYKELAGAYPLELKALAVQERLADYYSRPLVELLQRDPWDAEIQYWSDGDNYVMWSTGSDKATDKEWPLRKYGDEWESDTLFCNGRCLQWFEGWTGHSCATGDAQPLREWLEKNAEHIRAASSNNRLKPPAGGA